MKTKLMLLLLSSMTAFGQDAGLVVKVTQAPSGAHSVTLSCTPGIGGGTAVGFQFLRGTKTGGPYVAIGTLQTSCGYVDTDAALQDGQTYYYVAQAQNGGGQNSGNSNEAVALIPFLPCQPPTGLQATQIK